MKILSALDLYTGLPNAELASMAAATLKGRIGSSGDPQDLTPAQLRDNFFPSGSVINSAFARFATWTTYTALIPLDNTKPQISEGTQVLTVSITPSNVNNRIRVRAVLPVAQVSTGNFPVAALFRNGVTDALCAALFTGANGTTILSTMLEFEDTPNTTSAVTYQVRVGPSAASNLYLNSSSGALLGGCVGTTLSAEEIKA